MQERLNAARRAYEAEIAKKRAEELARIQAEQVAIDTATQRDREELNERAKRYELLAQQHALEREKRYARMKEAYRKPLIGVKEALIDPQSWILRDVNQRMTRIWKGAEEDPGFWTTDELDRRIPASTRYEYTHVNSYVGYLLEPTLGGKFFGGLKGLLYVGERHVESAVKRPYHYSGLQGKNLYLPPIRDEVVNGGSVIIAYVNKFSELASINGDRLFHGEGERELAVTGKSWLSTMSNQDFKQFSSQVESRIAELAVRNLPLER